MTLSKLHVVSAPEKACDIPRKFPFLILTRIAHRKQGTPGGFIFTLVGTMRVWKVFKTRSLPKDMICHIGFYCRLRSSSNSEIKTEVLMRLLSTAASQVDRNDFDNTDQDAAEIALNRLICALEDWLSDTSGTLQSDQLARSFSLLAEIVRWVIRIYTPKTDFFFITKEFV